MNKKQFQRIWELEEKLPASLVRPIDGKLLVILDEGAAGQLSHR